MTEYTKSVPPIPVEDLEERIPGMSDSELFARAHAADEGTAEHELLGKACQARNDYDIDLQRRLHHR